jgi:CRISPR/Cas system-associated endoribonuclease Cas2
MDVGERNARIKLRKQRKGLGVVQKRILLLLASGVALSCAHTPKRQWQIIKAAHAGWQDIKRQAAERAVEALYESRLIVAKENKDGTVTLLLSDNGKKRALRYKTYFMKVAHFGPWDKRWWIVLYDIPEDEREARDAFRDHLKRLGFRKFQHSAGIYPFDCRKEIEFIVELLDIRKYVRVIEATHIDDEFYWKRVFKLE